MVIYGEDKKKHLIRNDKKVASLNVVVFGTLEPGCQR